MLSAVIPVYNEADSLPELHRQLLAVAKSHDLDIEILFIDDGSRDESWQVIERLSREDSRVRGFRLRRNFGKAAALSAGFDAARGEILFTLDADLQDDPAEIPRFLEQVEQGYDCVSGWKKIRHDPWHKVLPSRVFNWMIGVLTGVKLHDHNCGFKCYRREIFDEVRIYGELHRFVPVLASARGWKVGEVIVQHRAREHGVSKYGFTRFVKGFLDLLTVSFLTGYAQRPQHLLGTMGLVAFGVGLTGLIYLAVLWLIVFFDPQWNETHKNFYIAPLHDRPLLLYCLGVLLFGAQLISTGSIAEMLVSLQVRNQPTYSIKQRCGEKGSGIGDQGSEERQ